MKKVYCVTRKDAEPTKVFKKCKDAVKYVQQEYPEYITKFGTQLNDTHPDSLEDSFIFEPTLVFTLGRSVVKIEKCMVE